MANTQHRQTGARRGVTLAACLWLGGCAGTGTTGQVPQIDSAPPKIVELNPKAFRVVGTPTVAYGRIARNIHQCWLKVSAPRLKGHGFFAEAPPPGERISVTIYQRNPDGKKGLRAFAIDLSASGDATDITTENFRLAPADAQALGLDIVRWAQGAFGCTPQQNA